MALCGDNEGITRLSLKKYLILFQNRIVSLQVAKRWIAVSSSILQKEQYLVYFLPNINSFWFKNNILCNILYWKHLNLESIVTILGRQ